MKMVDASLQGQVKGLDEFPGKVNYFIGNDPSKWIIDIPTYAKAVYQEIYPGVDLVFHGNQEQLEYDFVVSPGVDPGIIRFEIEGPDRLELDGRGDLNMQVGDAVVVKQRPTVYQEVAGVRQEVESGYARFGENRFGFQIGEFDSNAPLIIDPILSFSSYLGGSGNDYASGMAVDSAGNAYVVGWTESTTFPTASPLQATKGGQSDIFVSKCSPAGALLFSTYLGGSGDDIGRGIAVDSAGNAYITGETSSTDFPTARPLQNSIGGLVDSLVTKLNANGNQIVYSTFIGGNNADTGDAIAVDSTGSAYATGRTWSTNFPAVNAFQRVSGGASDVIVSKVNAAGTALSYSTYLGGRDVDYSKSIAVNGFGEAHVTGITFSTNFPTMNPWQGNNRGGVDAFVTKFSSSGQVLYSTYLGGASDDLGNGITVDNQGNACITGGTESANFPTVNPLYPDMNGYSDIFVAKMNPTGSAVLYSTFLGGEGGESGKAIAADTHGNVCITGDVGSNSSTQFPLVNPLQASFGGGADAFVTKMSADGQGIIFSTFLGGNGDDRGTGVGFDPSGNVCVTGSTTSSSFPTASSFQPINRGLSDAFIARIVEPPLVQRLIVASFNNDSIHSYDSKTGVYLGSAFTVTDGGLRGPLGLSFGSDGSLYVASSSTNSIKRFSGTTGAFINDFVLPGSGGLAAPSGLTFGPDGNLYVASRNGVLRYQGNSGAFLDVFVPNFTGGLLGAQDVAFGPDGNMYVCNGAFFNSSILRYNGITGSFLDAFVPSGSGGLNGPQALIFGPDGSLYVSSKNTNHVLKYHGITGSFIGVAASGNDLSAPFGLAFGPDRNLYVSSMNTNSVKRFHGSTGSFIDDFVQSRSGGLSGPSFLAFSPCVTCVSPSLGLVSRWPGDRSADDRTGGRNSVMRQFPHRS
ncbi:MAG: SBBP repeat-containing protein [Acidobacteria bacterium]|nr:SBBP repeat-containing protein [Acidobacteriota bacterium]